MNQLNAENFSISTLSLNHYINQAYLKFLKDVEASIKEMWSRHISVLNVELISDTATLTFTTYTNSDFSISIELQLLQKDAHHTCLVLNIDCPISDKRTDNWIENNKNLSPDSIAATILCYC